MKLTDFFLAELEREAVLTRSVLERVPMARPDWKPHEKSMTIARLASHVAVLPTWAIATIAQDELDIAPVSGPPYTLQPLTSTEELVRTLDENVMKAREALAGTTDAHLEKPWTLLAGGQIIFTQPRHEVLRSSVFNHLVHHRAQLTVYLRLNDVAVPSIYGPSADEGGR
jgi:uncharacterized damage-inducible protein DinB